MGAVIILWAVAGIVFCFFVGIGIMNYLQNKATLGGAEAVDIKQLNSRLDEMDQRLTDIQDVMIALSEKFDRWETDRKVL